MRRRRFLALVAASPLLAGCNSIPSSGTADEPSRTQGETQQQTTTNPDTDSETRTTVSDALLRERDPPSPEQLPTAARPPATEPPNATEDTNEPLSYPDNPASYTAEAVGEFVEAYERAYRRNDLLDEYGSALAGQGLYPNGVETLAVTEGAGVGRIQYTYSATVKQADGYVIDDSVVYLVTYYVDESVVVRAATTDQREHRDVLVPDPWESGVILKSHE
jgi:hypothetical protein